MANTVTEAFIIHDDPELGDYLTRSREAAERSELPYTELVKRDQWRDIATAPRGKQIMLGKWCEDMWFWIASGSIEIDGMHWCDLIDASFEPFSHADPTHWRPIDAPPTLKDTP